MENQKIRTLADLEQIDPNQFLLTKDELSYYLYSIEDDLFKELNEKYSSHLLPSSDHILIYALILHREDPTITPEQIAAATIKLQSNEN